MLRRYLIALAIVGCSTRLFSLRELWQSKLLRKMRLFPVHDSSVYPHFAAVPSEGYSLIHQRAEDVQDIARVALVHSACRYKYMNESFFILNMENGNGTSDVALDVDIDELHELMSQRIEMRIKPSYVCVDPFTVRFSAVWHNTSTLPLRHFVVKLLPLNEAIAKDHQMGMKGYYPTQWESFVENNTMKVLCIWRKGFGVSYRVHTGHSFAEMVVEMENSNLKMEAVTVVLRQDRQKQRQVWIVWNGENFSWSNLMIPQSSQVQWPEIDSEIQGYMKANKIPSISICVTARNRVLYSASYGFADIRKRKQATVETEYRIASVSKIITAMLLTKLLRRFEMTVNAKVFGPTGILHNFDVHSSLYTITIQHLLEHSTGAWSHFDKIEFNRKETNSYEFLQNILSDTQLQLPAGHQYMYSNIGYILLGKVIEKLANKSYEKVVSDELLLPLNITARIGRAEPGPKEAIYYSPDNANPYDHWSPRIFEASGGWVFSPCELALIMADLEEHRLGMYFPMTRRSKTNFFYGEGLQLGYNSELFHMGSLAGSEALAYTDKSQVVFLTNIRGQRHNVHTDWMKSMASRITAGVNKEF